jgi:hypothetical protein
LGDNLGSSPPATGFVRYASGARATAPPTRPEFHLVSGAAHFAFLAPCSPQLAQVAPEVCRDPNGFDRVAFHREMNGKVAAFFAARLKGAD